MWAPYFEPVLQDMVSDLSSHDLISGSWWGGYVYNRHRESSLWQSVLKGKNSIWYYTVAGGHGMVNLDLSPNYRFIEQMEAVSALTEGLGEYILHCRKYRDAVAVHYSPANIILGSFKEWNYMGRVHAQWFALLQDMGISPVYVTPEQIEQGILKKNDIKALILPQSICISGKEAEKIEKFAAEGGTVIADIYPGVRTIHGKPLQSGQLDAVFGVRHTGGDENAYGLVPVNWIVFEDNPFGKAGHLSIDGLWVNEKVSLAGGKRISGANGAPLAIVNDYKKGKTLLLNFDIDFYVTDAFACEEKIRDISNAKSLRNIVHPFIRAAGVKKQVTIKDENGFDPLTVQTAIFERDGIRLLGLLKSLQEVPGQSNKTIINLDGKYHVYDVMEKKYIGHVNSFSTKLVPGKAKFFSLMPYKTGKILLTPAKTMKIGADFSVKATMKGATKEHLLRVKILDGSGNVLPWSTSFSWSGGENSLIEGWIASNENPGQYKLKVQDVLTGNEAYIDFTLAP